MKIKKGFTLRTVMGQNIVLAEGNNSDSFGKIITLNPSGAMLWNELKGKDFEATDAARLLVSAYGIDPEQALADATDFLNLMDEKSLLDR